MQEKYNVGIYCRLSRDDERTGESVSIENQENICQGGSHPKDAPTQTKIYQRVIFFSNFAVYACFNSSADIPKQSITSL